jgi:hypothetical protein
MNIALDSGMLRLLWSAIEDNQRTDLMNLSDTALVTALIQQVSGQTFLRRDDQEQLKTYICTKLPLIRDMADGRQSPLYA